VPTRAQIEQEIVNRAEAWMTNAGFAVTFAGANADLNSPLAWAIRQAGGSVTNIALVADADVSTVASEDLDLLLDMAELRTLENVLANFVLVDAKAGPVEAKASQFADRLERRITALRGWIATTYGIGGTTQLTGGVLTLDILE
jgi:hypothetical protein